MNMSLKLLGKNTIIYAIGNVCWRTASFLLIPLYTHSLSVTDYGLLATLLVSIQLMVIFMSMGMRNALLRFSKEYEVDNRIGDLVGTSSSINLLSGLIVTAVWFALLIPFLRSVLHTNKIHSYIGMACCVALLQSLSLHIMTYYRARNQAFKFLATGVSAAAILFAASFVLLYVLQLGIVGALLALITTYAAILLFLLMDVFSEIGIGISISLMPKLLRFGFPFVFSLSGQYVVLWVTMSFLGHFAGLEAVAIYSLGYKLAQVVTMTIHIPFALAFQPYVFANLDSQNIKEKISRALTYLVLATAFMSLCILLASRVLLPLIAPPEYSSAFLVILLLLPGMVLAGIYYFGETLLSAAQKTHIIGFIVTVGTIFSIALNWLLIPVLGQYGAIISVSASSVFIGVSLLKIGLNELGVTVEWRRISIVGCLFGVFLSVMFLLRDAGYPFFYGTFTGLAIVSLFLLCSSSFCNEQERLILQNAVVKLKLTVFR